MAGEVAAALTALYAPHRDRQGLTRFIFAFPVRVVARLLGVPGDRLDDVTSWVRHYVAAVSPLADAAALDEGKRGASELIALFRDLLQRHPQTQSDALLGIIATQFVAAGHRPIEPIIANAIGFMTQTYEATAALIGSTLLSLADHDDARAAVRRDPTLIDAAVTEVLLIDPPTHSTRRFLARDAVVSGQPMRAGDAVLVLVAAAGRDPAANPAADTFNIFREQRRILNFGAGRHACPADRIAPRIASLAATHLLGLGLDLNGLRDGLSYMPSVAVRAPLFGDPSSRST
ncbi:MAG TPA: cytochrome P450 [Vineibacter sp.]|nr:cytochrome P450 [Vineibacter sp.]